MFTVYLLTCSDGTYHSGVTKNLDARLGYHESGKNENSYTFARRPVKLVFKEDIKDVRTAIAFEAELRTKSDQEIKRIIKGNLKITVATKPEIPESFATQLPLIIPSSYIGNLAYFSELSQHQQLIIDINERFQKQSYRSRCTIYSANGLQNLVVPLIRPNGKDSLMSEILISYTEDWQKIHLKAIESAYRRAPYYEYYADGLFAIIQKKHERLVDLNKELTAYFLQCFGIKSTIRFSTTNEESSIPLKNLLNPKLKIEFKSNSYQQVLNTGEFENNLSIVDLLFNIGKEGTTRLK